MPAGTSLKIAYYRFRKSWFSWDEFQIAQNSSLSDSSKIYQVCFVSVSSLKTMTFETAIPWTTIWNFNKKKFSFLNVDHVAFCKCRFAEMNHHGRMNHHVMNGCRWMNHHGPRMATMTFPMIYYTTLPRSASRLGNFLMLTVISLVLCKISTGLF